MIEERYRADYPGEFVVVSTVWANGKKVQNREWIANPIENHHISGRAVCIGSKQDLWQFDHTRLQNHRGGLLGSKKLQTYGVGEIAHDMRLDFVVDTDQKNLQHLINNKYAEKNIVYTTAKNCIAFPGQFYLIPNAPKVLPVASIVYLAAFDGHQEIFLIGYNKDTDPGNVSWIEQVSAVMDTYKSVKFYMVGVKTNIHDQWFERSNCEHLTYRDFISYCDV